VEEVMKDEPEHSRILDMCTGSGCILISLLHYSNWCEGVGADISSKALAVARKNADKLLAEEKQPTFIESDLFEKVEGKYDVIVVNPPYIPSEDVLMLESEVKDYEPHLALDGGLDGLDIYRRIKESYLDYLTEGGALIMEIVVNQAEAIEELFGKVEFIKDYNNPPIERVAVILNGVK
jgi:release factor glutamine methyltransferase